MKFVTFFPELKNYHLNKDVGLIPRLLKKYHKYDVTIVSYKNEEKYLYNNEVNIVLIDKKYGVVFDFLIYLIKNIKKIDVLNLYHVTSARNFKWILVYKLLNKKGKVYLKLDADKNINLYNFNKKSIKQKIKNKILKNIDLVTVENFYIRDLIKSAWDINVEFLPNGFYDNDEVTKEFKNKKNIILTVGRIGSYQKATEILLEAFARASENLIENWKLIVAGEIDNNFKEYINNYMNINYKLKDKVEFIGNVNEFNELRKLYRESKIFCLPSRYESFGLVLVEALMEGCYIVTSNHESATTIVRNDDVGIIFDIDDINDLSEKLINICNYKNFNEHSYKSIQNYAYDNFYWKDIIARLDSLITAKK